VIGAINGWAAGSGFEWAINCDFPIWAESTQGFFLEVSLNLFVTGAATALLPAMVGLVKAREMLFLGRRYSAAELGEMGVTWKVVPVDALVEEARTVARQLAALQALSVRAMKCTLSTDASTNMRRALPLETDATAAGFIDPETTKLLKAF
jgi:enoyl-CoA hydratase/carnithine racemase